MGSWEAQVAQMVKNLPDNSGDASLITGSGRPSGEGNGTPFQYSCLENLMDRGAWWATVHGVAKNQNNWTTKLSEKLLCDTKAQPSGR